ncbi:uncharacterized protein Z520_11570 [Fonsecaea multimorphosa CBS 102226]|uniref:Uncharacterized protein n=1 Tax=Fonsecaea multimorphosa CBS 102226 TaxID=1442371 RepID=A0A0D2K8N6_9EURO|nr:uncharacterized protein Z520_11570 [Fonsecaea multimorphosa CBS 102226]KIX92718.1 hypothetical protein Z520_11570 [Fonsecaea multimorphosa CBS 102226]OAL17960.1 hypothetical protein AYO22_11116 [Fonsecaea multimorphosa]
MAFTAGTPQNAGFTGVGTQDINTSSLASMASSLESEFTQTTGSHFTRTNSGASQTGTSSTDSSSAGASTSSTATQTASTTFATSVTPSSGGPLGSPNSSLSSYATSATNAAASTTGGAVTVSEKSSCNSISCSSALKAAVAVPIVVAAIAGILLFFFCARRRRRRGGAVMSEKTPKKAGKKWTRHLRAFSFDAELLMGGRFSSSNSIRSRDPSVRSGPGTQSRGSAHSGEPSMHSIEEVAPPYRDAVTHVTPPSPARSIPQVTTITADPIPRPSSTATAPPPYRAIVGGTGAEPPSPSTVRSAVRNPFADSAPVSPIEGSPFNDPPEEASGALRPTMSRGSSMYRSVMTDDDASPGASEAGSIRQAMVGRRVSVRNSEAASGGGGSST